MKNNYSSLFNALLIVIISINLIECERLMSSHEYRCIKTIRDDPSLIATRIRGREPPLITHSLVFHFGQRMCLRW